MDSVMTILAIWWVRIVGIPLHFMERELKKKYAGWRAFFLYHGCFFIIPLLVWLARFSDTDIIVLLTGAFLSLFIGFVLGVLIVSKVSLYYSGEESKKSSSPGSRKATRFLLLYIAIAITIGVLMAGNVWFLIGFCLVIFLIGLFIGTALLMKIEPLSNMRMKTS